MDSTEGIGESSTPPRTYAAELTTKVHKRLMENGSEDVRSIPNLLDLLEAHFIRLPLSYGLDVDLDKAEDVLLHHRLLKQAEIPANRPAFFIRFLERAKSDGKGDIHLSSANTELIDSHKQQEVANPSSKRTKDGAAEFEPCSKLEDLNMDVLKNIKDMVKITSDEPPQRRVRKSSSLLTHEVIFSAVDKPKLLSQLSALLSDIGLNIREAHVFSTTDGYSLDVFVVDGWHEEDTARLNEAMKNAIAYSEQRRSSLPQFAIEAALPPTSFDWEVDLRLLKRGEKIGSGSCGDVYRGTYLGQDVAIKEFNSVGINDTPMSEFVHEVKILREVQHRNVVHFFGACTKSPFLCIVTEYMSGGSLFDYLREHHESLKLSQLLNFASDICEGMDYLHSNKIIHRDLKTANLLLDSKNVVKVSDFGIARFQNQGVMTAETGTYRWMAPEVLNHLPYDERADVFSFAVVLWELITAKVPYETMTPLQAALGVRQGLRPEIPETTHPKLRLLIERCWDADPTRRPNFSGILIDLRCLLYDVKESEVEGSQ